MSPHCSRCPVCRDQHLAAVWRKALNIVSQPHIHAFCLFVPSWGQNSFTHLFPAKAIQSKQGKEEDFFFFSVPHCQNYFLSATTTTPQVTAAVTTEGSRCVYLRAGSLFLSRGDNEVGHHHKRTVPLQRHSQGTDE